MATVYTKTDNYGLDLYGDNDPADLRDGYNNSMRTIDTALENHLNKIEKAESEVQHDSEVVKALTGDGTVDSAKTAKTKWDKAATDGTTAIAALTALGSETAIKATANKTKWDKASTDSTATTTALTALGSETAVKATANKTKWDGYETLFKNYVPLHDWTKPTAVFGDSIALGTGTTTRDTDAWTRKFAAKLGSSEIRMYATNNAGFTVAGTDGKTVIQQIQGSSAKDRSEVGTVIISAGINDFNADSTTLTSAMRNAINEVLHDFPDAAIIVVPCLCGNNPRISHTFRNAIIASHQLSQGYARARDVWIVPYAWEINAFQSANRASDNIHLTTVGAEYTANAILDYVFHNVVTRANTPAVPVTLGPGIQASKLEMTIGCANGTISLAGQIVLSQKVTAFTRFINLPQGFEYERIIPAMIATTGASLFYNTGYSNTIDSFSDISSGSTVYANSSWTYAL